MGCLATQLRPWAPAQLPPVVDQAPTDGLGTDGKGFEAMVLEPVSFRNAAVLISTVHSTRLRA